MTQLLGCGHIGHGSIPFNYPRCPLHPPYGKWLDLLTGIVYLNSKLERIRIGKIVVTFLFGDIERR